METLGWPPNYVARCPVTLYEAAGGSLMWHASGTVGELHMRPLGSNTLHFQLHDLLDGQMLFEHTMRRAEAFSALSRRFFVVRQENGTFRGFGFSEKAAAAEMKERIFKALNPVTARSLQQSSTVGSNKETDKVTSKPKGTWTQKKSSNTVVSYRSVPKRSSARTLVLNTEQPRASVLPPILDAGTPELQTFTSSTKPQRKRSRRWETLRKGLKVISQLFDFREHEMEIGYPTDVKHVAHIGWDGPSINGPSWMDELRPAPDFSSAPLCNFGQPRGPDWIHDASSAAKWTSSNSLSRNFELPPAPPAHYLDSPEAVSASKVHEPGKQL
ncbi:hypothetical protein O6H91_02G096200 [Diphasiastrum complanatum]|uniref:Uncharacterized protein n=1 Tax=Diphasiastrum complanatum TaxID=34168 RepID=A0ACC2EIS3_DIPCM|nr:hypothetical protein O6H91_02G096200 [Diphasiastrum complanatum]